MEFVFDHSREEDMEKLAHKIAEEIRLTKKVKIGNETFRVDRVDVMEGWGVVSGWNVFFKTLRGDIAWSMTDRGERTYMRVILRGKGLVIGVGEDYDGTRAVVVYKNK